MFDLTGKRHWFFLISALVILAGVITLLTAGLTMGIEFNSGSKLRVSFDEQVSQNDLRARLAEIGYPNAILQASERGDYLIRTERIDGEQKEAMLAALGETFGAVTEQEFNNVSAEVASETGRNVIIAVAIASLGILFYVTWAFRRMPKPFHYGACGILALVHDVLVVIGVFAILGAIFKWQVNLMFITGVLAVIGYSINNTVVVFDRIRENINRGVSNDFEVVINSSLIETIGRSVNTSLTTLLVAVALLLFVGANILNFAVVLIIGVIVGTYSSMFIAPLFLLTWEKKEWRRLLPWKAGTA
jgi:preprotein translocase subunit SecF